MRHINVHLSCDSSFQSQRILSDELEVVEQLDHALKGTHQSELILVDAFGSGGHFRLGLVPLVLLMHMHILHLAIVALVVNKSIVHVLLLEIVVKRGQLLGRSKQLSCDLSVRFLGLVQLLFEV